MAAAGSSPLTIYNEYIDSDLTWFPVTISTSDIPSDYFAGLTDFSDDFDGADDSVADVRYWYDNQGTYTIQNNKIRSGQATGSAHDLNFNFRAVGDFDIQVDFDVVLGPDVAGWGYDLTAQQNNGVTMGSTRARSGDGQGYRSWYNPGTGGAWTSLTSKNDSSGQLRLTRIGIQWTSYYWDSGWQQIHQMNQTSAVQDVFLNFRAQSWNVPPTVQVDFDNFIITADKLIPKNPEKTTYFTDIDGNILYTEVEHVDFTNELATFHTAVPTVSAGDNTPLTFNWNFAGRDYSIRGLPAADYDYAFTGANGSQPDPAYFTANPAAPATVEIQSNKLNIHIISGVANPADATYVPKLYGNFDVQVDYDLTTFPNSSYWGIMLSITDSNGAGADMIRGRYNYHAYRTYLAGWQTETATGDSSGKLRITRVGNTWTTYFWGGSSWTQNYTTTVSTDPGEATVKLLCRHGNTNPEVEANWDNFTVNSIEYNQDEVNDTFTGSDGDAPDEMKWDIDTTTIGPEIQGNNLRIGVDTNDSSGTMTTKFALVGNFDIEFGWDMLTSEATNHWYVILQVYKVGDTSTWTDLRYGYHSNSYKVHGWKTTNTNYSEDSFGGAQDTGKLRLVRSGSTVTPYYDIGSGWVADTNDGGTGVGSNDAIVSIKVQATGDVPTTTADIDNFQINSADSITGWTEDTGNLPAQTVWDSDFVFVCHMAQDPDGGVGSILDSTSTPADGDPTEGGMDGADLVDGIIGKALDFDGDDDRVNYSNPGKLTNIANRTDELIVYADTYGEGSVGALLRKEEWWTRCDGVASKNALVYQLNTGLAAGIWTTPTDSFPTGAWKYVGVEWDRVLWASADPIIQIDDTEVIVTKLQNPTGWLNGDGANNLKVAGDDSGNNSFNGRVAEVRQSKIFRGTAWRIATYNSLMGNLFAPSQWNLVIQDMTVATSTDQVEFIVSLIIQNLNVLTSAEITKLIPLLNINNLDMNTTMGKMIFWEALETINTAIIYKTLKRTVDSKTLKRIISSKTLKRTLDQING